MTSVFVKYYPKAYPYNFLTTLQVQRIAGGIPSDPKVAEGWIRSKLGTDDDDLIRRAVAEVMVERELKGKPVTADEAAEEVARNRHLSGFKRADDNELYIEGRQVKAAIKEAANVRWPKDRWGPSKKGTVSFFAEHVFVQEDRIPLGVLEPSGINQSFVHTWRGSGIQYEEYVTDVKVSFTVATDHEFTDEQWGLLWLTGQMQGLGASRSTGMGRYEVVEWEPLDTTPRPRRRRAG